MALSARKVQTAETGKYLDGDGLWLIKRSKDKGKWVLRFRYNGSRREMGLGAWPLVSLAEARGGAELARKQISQGIDPIQARKEHEQARAVVPTFAECAELAFEARKASLRGEGVNGRWMSPLTLHIIPKMGSKLVTEIDQNDVAAALRPIWRKKYPTADKAAGRIHTVLEYAVAQGHMANLIAVKMARVLLGDPGHKVEHHAAMPWQDVPAYYQSLGVGSTVRRVLSFMLLVGGGARTTPVRLARYDEIEGNQWTIPAENMKGMEGKVASFRIPLSRPALDLIEICSKLHTSEWIFPGPSGNPITDVMTSKFMNDLPYTPHGFRSSFREWMAEQSIPHEVAETALAHQVGTKVTRAYMRDDYWTQRSQIMDDWAEFLTQKKPASQTASRF